VWSAGVPPLTVISAAASRPMPLRCNERPVLGAWGQQYFSASRILCGCRKNDSKKEAAMATATISATVEIHV
jgi:hypothetical protein